MPTDRTDIPAPAEPDTDAIFAALEAAGLTVTDHQVEADSVDIHLAHRSHPDYAGTALSWRPDGQGWYLLPVDPDDDAETVLPDYLGLTTPAFIAEAITEAVEVPATIPDLTALRGVIRALTAAGWVADRVTAMSDGSRVHDYLHPTGRGITVQVHQGGTVELTLTDLTRDQAVGAIGGAGLAPTAEVAPEPAPADYWLSLAVDLHQVADRIATLAGTTPTPANVNLNILGDVSARTADRMVPVVDAIAEAFGGTAGPDEGNARYYSARVRVGAVHVYPFTVVPDRQESELERLRARVAELESQQGGESR